MFLYGAKIMTKTEFRLKVEEELKDLAKKPKTKLKIAFEVNGKMKGTSISEGGDVDILFSPRQEVMYVDFSETSKSKIELIKTSLKKTFGTFAKDDGTKDSSSHRIKLGEKGAAKNNRDILNFRILKSGARTPTAIQERGSAFIFSVALDTSHPKSQIDLGKDHIALEKNKYVYDGLKKIFTSAYEERIKDWTYTYYQQQKQFLDEFKGTKWSEFVYGNQSFVKFFEGYIKNIYLQFDPPKQFQKYEQWNPADIYAAYDMPKIKSELDELFKGEENQKGVNLFRLNNYLINLLKEKKLVGISLKKIKKPDNAELVLRNIDDQSYLDPKIETKQYKMKDINFVIDGIHDRSKKTVSTYIKFGEGYQVDVKGSSSKFNNLAFGTLIKAKSAAQGGNAPIELVIGLMKKNGSDIKFKNDNTQYPTTIDEFFSPNAKYSTKDYQKWFTSLKKYFTASAKYVDFEDYITRLYQDDEGPIAQSKLMQLHFYYDSLKTNDLKVDYWLKILYLGMKVGKRFAPHAKIY